MGGVEVEEEVGVHVEEGRGRGEVELGLLELHQGRLVREKGGVKVAEDLGVLGRI